MRCSVGRFAERQFGDRYPYLTRSPSIRRATMSPMDIAAAADDAWWASLASMEHVQILLITIAATFMATLPAVYLGLRRERATRDKEARARHRGYLYSAGRDELVKGEQLIYDIRDWAGFLKLYYQGQLDFGELDVLRHRPGQETLRYLLSTDSFPRAAQSDVMLLADYLSVLNSAFANAMMTELEDMTPAGKRNLIILANRTHLIADTMVHGPDLREQLARELKL